MRGLFPVALPEVGKLCLRVQIRYPELGGLLPEYPKSIGYSSKSEGLFYIKITGFSDGIIYYSSTGDAGKAAIVLTRVEGSPRAMRLINVTNPLVRINPIVKAEDTALYFMCEGVTGRKFDITFYGSSKSNIEYTILGSVE